MVAVSVIAGSVYLWPQYLVTHAGTNGIYSLLTTAVIALGVTTLHVALAFNTGQSTYLKAVQRIVPFLGKWLLFPLIAMLCLATDGIILVLYAQMMRNFFYPLTPLMIIEVGIVAVAIWMAGRTLSTVARTVQFWLPIDLFLLGIMVSLSVGHWKFLGSLRPSSHFVIAPWIVTVVGTWFLYANGGIIVTLTPHVRWKTPRQAYGVATGAVLMQSAVLILLYVISIGTLGPDGVSHLYWPMVYIFSLVTVRAFFFKGLGAFVVMVWTSTIVLYLTVHLFCFGWSVSSAFDRPSPLLRWVIVALGGGLLVVVGMVVPSSAQAHYWLFHWFNPLDMGSSGITGMGLWLLSRRFRSRRLEAHS